MPPSQKIVSTFEPHTDIIKKGRREVCCGHKICLTTGASNVVLDLAVQEGNPADSTLAVRMAKRVPAVLGERAEADAFDGAFSSRQNVEEMKVLGVRDAAVSKSPGLEVKMVRSSPRSGITPGQHKLAAGAERGCDVLVGQARRARAPGRGQNRARSFPRWLRRRLQAKVDLPVIAKRSKPASSGG